MKLLSVTLILTLSVSLRYQVHACTGHEDHHHLRQERHLDDDVDFEFPPCGAEESKPEQRLEESKVMSHWKTRHANRDLGETNYVIPVHFHVLRDDDGKKGDVTDGMLYAYMQHVNEAFSSTPFSFLMSSVERIDNTELYKCTFSNGREAKTAHNVPGTNNLNVYLCDIQNGSGGWSYQPYLAGTNQDGVVIESNYRKYFVPSKGYIRRTVLPHEVGHWLGLYHTFQDECDSTYSKNDAWNNTQFSYYNGDGVSDTAAHTKGSKNCIRRWNTCPDDVEGVDPGNDPLDNLMSYAPERCQHNFTPGQQERMVAMYEHYRYDPDAPDPQLPTPPSNTYCDIDKCKGILNRLFGMTHRVHNISGSCRWKCVTQERAERWMKRGTHVCGRCSE
jgi:predicted Zn-dependent protease